MRALIAIPVLVLMAGCAGARFSTNDDGSFKLAKRSEMCALGSPNAVKQDLAMEAAKLCAMRREVPVEIESDSEYGIPYLRCASAWAVYRCEPKK